MLMHTGEKTHKFEKCDSAFAQKSNLKTHMLMHTGVKPHKCEKCDSAFAQKGNLKQHFHRHHTKEGQATRKKEEQRICCCLTKLGYMQATELGDAAPPAMHFCREKRIDFRCAGDIDGKYAYIDFVINPGGGKSLIFLEVDENQHRFGYGEAGCDMKRMGKVMESLTVAECEMRVVWLRYNPGSFKVDGATQDARSLPHYKKSAREQWLGNRITELRTEADDVEPGLSFAFEYAYYDCNSAESTTRPMVACMDAGYSSHFAEVTRISPGCMLASSSSTSSSASASSPSSSASASSPSSNVLTTTGPTTTVELNGLQLNGKIISALRTLASLWDNVEESVLVKAAQEWEGVSDPARLAQALFSKKHWRMVIYNAAASSIASSSKAFFRHNLHEIVQFKGIGRGILKNVSEFVDSGDLQSHAWLLSAKC
jgi:hypothetical protein